ncbi:hypothetical protein HIM_11272 [Hirsutella minnesotensis 3608]|uniref:Uncharacterized protein n=1 Tax=Hirsutella minnesotensis 3608 TaxID=1043627 RepID=A0A0F7ZWP5_9HYPO|nr:hypothetical protein HIM_11272 [Hirsutella minnesotensis 3608]
MKESPKTHLRTFSHPESTPEAVYAASATQLKRLIFNYRLRYKSSSYSFLWHTALMYVANATLSNPKEENRSSCLMLCINGYESLGRSWRVVETIIKALLWMTLRKEVISSDAAHRILHDLRNNNSTHIQDSIRATFMADLDLAFSDPRSATVECLAEQFEEHAALKDYTNILDEEGFELGD